MALVTQDQMLTSGEIALVDGGKLSLEANPARKPVVSPQDESGVPVAQSLVSPLEQTINFWLIQAVLCLSQSPLDTLDIYQYTPHPSRIHPWDHRILSRFRADFALAICVAVARP